MTLGVAVAGLAALALSAAGCNYGFRSGAGLPEHIRTIAIVPFENETDRFDITQEIHQALLQELPRSLGLTNAAEEVADAVVTGTISSYNLAAPSYRPGEEGRAEVLQREVSISISVRIVDRRENLILWENRGLRAQGRYPEAGGTEEEGRREAIEILVQRVIDGAQSNW